MNIGMPYTTNSIMSGLNLTTVCKNSLTKGYMGLSCTFKNPKTTTYFAQCTSLLATHLKKLSILVKINFLLRDRLTSTLSGYFFHFSLSALPFDYDSFSLSFLFLLIFSSVAFYLFLSACSVATISVIILFTLPLMLLSNNLKAKGSETKCTKKWKEFSQREWEEVLSSYGLRLEEHVVLVEHVLVGSCWGIGSIGNQNNWVHLKPKWSPRSVIDMIFVAIGQVTPPLKRTLDAPLLRIPSMNEIMWICLHPKTFPFHLVPLDLQVQLENPWL
jgi:hypothetical protein